MASEPDSTLTTFALPGALRRACAPLVAAGLCANGTGTKRSASVGAGWVVEEFMGRVWVTLGAPGCKTGGLKIRCRWFDSALVTIFINIYRRRAASRVDVAARLGVRTRPAGHPPDQAVEARSVFFRECMLERLDQHVRVLCLERQRRANLEHIAVAAG